MNLLFNEQFRLKLHKKLIHNFNDLFFLEKENLKSKYTYQNHIKFQLDPEDLNLLEPKFDFNHSTLIENPIQTEKSFGIFQTMPDDEPIRVFDSFTCNYKKERNTDFYDLLLNAIKFDFNVIQSNAFNPTEIQNEIITKNCTEKKLKHPTHNIIKSAEGKYDIRLSSMIKIIKESINQYFCASEDQVELFKNEWIIVKRKIRDSIHAYLAIYLNTEKTLIQSGYFPTPNIPRIYISKADKFDFNWMFSEHFSDDFLALGKLKNPFFNIRFIDFRSTQSVLTANRILHMEEYMRVNFDGFFNRSIVISKENNTYKNNIISLNNFVKLMNNQFYQLRIQSEAYYDFISKSIIESLD